MEQLNFRFIIDIEAIIDLDYGLLKFLSTGDKLNKKYFKSNILSESDAYFKNLIVSSKSDTILEDVLEDRYKDNATSLYYEIMNKYEEDIILNSILTDVYKLSNNWMNAKEAGIKCTANCRTDLQYEYCKKFMASDYTILKDQYDMMPYSNVIINRITDIILYEKNLNQVGKSIYYISRACNYKEDGTRLDLLDKYFPCSTKAIDMYVKFKYMKERN